MRRVWLGLGLVCDHKHMMWPARSRETAERTDSLDVDRLREELVDFVVGGEGGSSAPADPPALPARPDSHSAKTARARYESSVRQAVESRSAAADKRHRGTRAQCVGPLGIPCGRMRRRPRRRGAASLGPGSRRQPRACASWVAGEARGMRKNWKRRFSRFTAEPGAVVL